MKVVAAIDSFKGSLSSMEAGNAAKEGILLAKPGTEVVIKPLADGGEGTTDALIEGMNGEKVEMTAAGPLGTPVNCYYGYLPKVRPPSLKWLPPLASPLSAMLKKIRCWPLHTVWAK